MHLADLRPLYDRPGPYASVYIDTQRTDPQAGPAIDLRWRELRRRLAAEGADAATLDVLEAHVGSDRGAPAPQGQALFTAGGELVHLEELPAPPVTDLACYGRLPRVLPLLAQRHEFPPYVLALVDRVGADLQVRSPQRATAARSVNGDTTPIRKVKPGDWSQARFQRRAENTWDRNARGVAGEVERLGADYKAGLVVVGGDVRARSLLLEHLRSPWRERAVVLHEGGGRAEGADRERADAAALQAAAEREAALHKELHLKLAQNLTTGGAVQGLADAVEALRTGEVDILFLDPASPALDAPLWWGPAASELALEAEPLAGLGVAEPQRDQAADVLLRVLALMGGRVVVGTDEEASPKEGIGALLRAR